MSVSTRDFKRNDSIDFIDEPFDAMRMNPLMLIHRQLRGRYHMVVLLGVLLMLCGGLSGYILVPPKYESKGVVRITPTLPSVLYQSEENQAPPMFESFLTTQAVLIASRETLESALDSGLVQAGWPAGNEGIAKLSQSLNVRRMRNEQVITVRVTDRDPKLAKAAVNAVLTSYVKQEDDASGSTSNAREKALITRIDELKQRREVLATNMREASENLGLVAIQRLYAAKIKELEQVNEKLANLEFAKSRLELQDGQDNSGEIMGGIYGTLLVKPDQQLVLLINSESALKAEIYTQSRRLRPEHPAMVQLLRQLEAVRIQIQQRKDAIASTSKIAASKASSSGYLGSSDYEMILKSESVYRLQHEKISTDAADLDDRRTKLMALTAQAESLDFRLEEANTRMDQLQVEQSLEKEARFNIIAYGDLPLEPISDRRAGVAFIGSILGAATAVGIVSLFGLLVGRCRFAEELIAFDTEAQILGILPDIGRGKKEVKSQAGIVVHQISSALSMMMPDSHSSIFAVSSPRSGEGKTSLSLALGSAFAATGVKTLVMDMDLVAQGLTRHLKLTGKRGVCHALGLAEGSGQIHQTSTSNLWVMPTGAFKGLDSRCLSPQKFRWLISALRKKFEIVVIDTGPILESLEAMVATAAADQTILVASRGRKSRDVKAALSRLAQMQVRCCGLVFNRAAMSDCIYAEAMASRTKAWSQRLMNDALAGQSQSNEKKQAEFASKSTDANNVADTPALRLTKPDEVETSTVGSIKPDEQRRRAA
ncbi:MAG: AAA family ATPase [Planctomycetes bacterium]|nr:AAA family ATPase [Planctomycetota bacterium]